MSARIPTLYFDTFAGLVSLRRKQTTVNAQGTITSIVARTRGAYHAGDRVEFLWTSLVFKSRVRNFKQLVIPACSHPEPGVFVIAKQKYAGSAS